MQGKGEDGRGNGVLYRGRFIASEVDKAAPGRFHFTDITNYTGQQYGSAEYFAQFDVILLGDVIGWSLPDRFQQGLKQFVQNGGGFAYLASWKWQTALMNGTLLEEVLPARFSASGFNDDWKIAPFRLEEQNFKPQVTEADHPIVKSLNWANVPVLNGGFRIVPKPKAPVLLSSPRGAPLLAAWDFGKGRTAISASMFANDELSPQFGNWSDFGKYYAQLVGWLGANSPRRDRVLTEAVAEIDVQVNANATRNSVSARHFSIHAAHDDPGLAPLAGEALKNFQALNPKDGFARVVGLASSIEPQNDDDDPKRFHWPAFKWDHLNKQLAEVRRLELEPILLFEINYGHPQWVWQQFDSSWAQPKPRAIEEIAELVAATVEHVNGGNGNAPNYKPNVRYIEIGNEPDLNPRTIPGFAKLVKAVAQRIHRDYPGVQVGAFGGYEVPYLKPFLEAVNPDLDWVSRHPYGWTGERVFEWQDEVAAFQKAEGLRQIPFLITEWDYWIAGKPKFDYMMTRYFEAVRRENLLGTLHYRLGQYAEPVYLFGTLWAGWGQEKGAGAKGAPMHDAYDALWLFRDFRGQRVDVQSATAASTSPKVLDHFHADATRDGDKLNVVLYSDWAYDGTGYKDFERGLHYSQTRARLKLSVPPANRARVLSVARATGAGFETARAPVNVATGQRNIELTIELRPMTGYSIVLQ